MKIIELQAVGQREGSAFGSPEEVPEVGSLVPAKGRQITLEHVLIHVRAGACKPEEVETHHVLL